MKRNDGIEYEMSAKCFNSLCATLSEKEAKKNPYIAIMDIINATYGLKGTVVKLHVTQ